jgi:hypothetical protein
MVITVTPVSLKCSSTIRCHHLIKTFWDRHDRQLPDGTENLLRYTPWLYPPGQLGNGEHLIPSNPVANVAHGDG